MSIYHAHHVCHVRHVHDVFIIGLEQGWPRAPTPSFALPRSLYSGAAC